MRTIKRGLDRGVVQSIDMEIIYPDGTVLESRLDPKERDTGLLILSDAMVKRVAALGHSHIDLDAWEEAGKEWRHRPTYIVMPRAGSSRGFPYCDCCLHKHFVIGEDSRSMKITPPKRADSGPGGDRGAVRKLTIEVAYPNGDRARSTYHPSEDRTALIAFDDGLVESVVVPLIGKDDSALLGEWDKDTDDWRARPSFMVLAEPRRGCSGMDANCDCCYYYHRTNEILS